MIIINVLIDIYDKLAIPATLYVRTLTTAFKILVRILEGNTNHELQTHQSRDYNRIDFFLKIRQMSWISTDIELITAHQIWRTKN